jgi:hypothetical protein
MEGQESTLPGLNHGGNVGSNNYLAGDFFLSVQGFGMSKALTVKSRQEDV